MSKATVAPIEPLIDTRGAASFNTPFTAIATAAAALDASNFAEEGLDARLFPAHSNANRLATIVESTRAPIAINAAFGPTYVHNGTVFRTGALGQIDINNPLRVFVQVQTQTTLVDRALDINLQYEFRLVWFDGAVATVVAQRGLYNTVSMGEAGWMFEAWIWVATPTNVAYVELQNRNTGVFRPNLSSLVVDKFINRTVTQV
ncbi:MAG TPA: hypothetical protein VI792_03255 [Candidatus Eisenbacteria bacterium]